MPLTSKGIAPVLGLACDHCFCKGEVSFDMSEPDTPEVVCCKCGDRKETTPPWRW